tara:strand:+ start:1066 stop:1863 length:798 start_codon:yes stop_codon:yes gene_type:complete
MAGDIYSTEGGNLSKAARDKVPGLGGLAGGVGGKLAALSGIKGLGWLGGPWGAALGLGLEYGPKLAGFFKSDKTSTRAAETQQNIEKAAMDIDAAVRAGRMDPDSAIAALDSLSAFANRMQGGGENQFGRAGTGANLIIQQVRANIETIRTARLSEPFDPTKGFTGSPGFQRDRFATSLRNFLGGAKQGDFIGDSPAGIAFGKYDTEGGYNNISDQVGERFPIGVDSTLRPQEDVTASRERRREARGLGRVEARDRINDLFLRKV